MEEKEITEARSAEIFKLLHDCEDLLPVLLKAYIFYKSGYLFRKIANVVHYIDKISQETVFFGFKHENLSVLAKIKDSLLALKEIYPQI